MPKPYPKEFRDDVVAVARRRDPKTTLRQIAADFGISESCLTNWLARADREDGIRPGRPVPTSRRTGSCGDATGSGCCSTQVSNGTLDQLHESGVVTHALSRRAR